MLIEQKEIKGKGMFYVRENDKILAEMVYHMETPEKMVIEHTEVDDSLGGKGVGHQLVHHGVEYARANNIKIVPLCPFAKSIFDRKPEYGDVLAPKEKRG